MRMSRAVAVVVERDALTRRAAARGRTALDRLAIGVDAGHRKALQVLVCSVDVTLDDRPDARLCAHREARPDVVEQRAARPREVVPIRDESFDRRLAGMQHVLVCAYAPDQDRPVYVPAELSIDGPAELVHD